MFLKLSKLFDSSRWFDRIGYDGEFDDEANIRGEN